MTYVADSERYEALTYSRAGYSGLLLPPLLMRFHAWLWTELKTALDTPCLK
jgi:hypothetical protein